MVDHTDDPGVDIDDPGKFPPLAPLLEKLLTDRAVGSLSHLGYLTALDQNRETEKLRKTKKKMGLSLTD